MTLLTPGTVAMRCWWAEGKGKVSETECRVQSRSGLASELPLVDSVKTVASVMIKNKDTTILEPVSSVRRLLRRIFLKMNLLNFMERYLLRDGLTSKSDGMPPDRHCRRICGFYW